jgi:hypothetical protein
MLRRGMVLRAGGGRGPANPWQQVINKFSKKAVNQATSKAKEFAKTANAQQVVQSVARTAAAAEQVARAQFSKLQEQFNSKTSSNNNNQGASSNSSSSNGGSEGGSSKKGDSPFAAFWEFISSLSSKMGPHFRKIVESLGVTMTVSLLYYLYNTSHGLMAALESYKESVRRQMMRESHLQEIRESMEDSSDDTYAGKSVQQHNFGDAGGVTANQDSGSSHGLQKAMSGNNDEEALRQRLQRRDERRRKRTAEEDGVSYYDEGNTKRLEEEQMNRSNSGRGLDSAQQHKKSKTELIATSLLREAEEEAIRQQLDVSTQQSYYAAGGSAKAKVEDGNRRKDNRRAMTQLQAQHRSRQLALHAKRKAVDMDTTAGMPQADYDRIFSNSFFFKFGNAPLDHSVMPAAGHNMQTAPKDSSLTCYGTAPGQGQLPTVTPNFNEYTNGGFRTAEMAGTAASVHAPTGRYLSGVGTAFQVRCLKKMDGYFGTEFAARKLENLNRKAPPGYVMDPLSGRFSRIETIENSEAFTGGIEGNESPSFDFRHSMSM